MTATIADLFEALGHHPGERVSICHRVPGERFTAAVVDVAEAERVVAAWADSADVWWGVNPVDPMGGRGSIDDVTRWAALYADLDVKPGGMPSIAVAQSVINEVSNILGALPVAVTHSGHGLQPYWALDPEDPDTDLTDCDRRTRAQTTLRRFGRLVAAVASRYGGHVDSVFDLPRVLRAPATVNRKEHPVPVVTSLMLGSPLTVDQLAERLTEYGIPAFVDDGEAPGEMVSSPDGWLWALRTCGYSEKMISGWPGDRPLERHPWFVGQATRLAAARRNGCLTEADYRRAAEVLDKRMGDLVATTEPLRKLSPGELADGHAWAVARVSAMSDGAVRAELGGHKHEQGANLDSFTLLQGGGIVTDETSATIPVTDRPSWARTDLTAFLDGTYKPQEPELLRRVDGRHLLYRGRVHSFHGESESGKSWAALYAAAEVMLAGEDVVMIDFESDAATTVGRLLALGVPTEVIAARFDYRRPEVSPAQLDMERIAWLDLLTHRYGVAIIDGITEALAVYGVTSKDNDEVTRWVREVPRRIAAQTTAAVIDVDHVTKDADTRGRFAIGGQAKMAALDGAAYVVEVVEPLGVGLVGRISLRVAKDRPGGIRPISGTYRKTDRTQESCILVIDSTTAGRTEVRVETPRTEMQEDVGDGPWRPTVLMERVSRFLEAANAAIARDPLSDQVYGKKGTVLQAIDFLIEDGYAAADGPSRNGGKPSIRLVKPYRETGDPFPDARGLVNPPDPPPETPTPSLSKDQGMGGRGPSGFQPLPGNGSGRGWEGVDDPDLFDGLEDPDE